MSKFQGASSIYVASNTVPLCNLEEIKDSVQVEFLPDYVYCLVPSIGSNRGFWKIHKTIPDFAKNIQFWLFLAKLESGDSQCNAKDVKPNGINSVKTSGVKSYGDEYRELTENDKALILSSIKFHNNSQTMLYDL